MFGAAYIRYGRLFVVVTKYKKRVALQSHVIVAHKSYKLNSEAKLNFENWYLQGVYA